MSFMAIGLLVLAAAALIFFYIKHSKIQDIAFTVSEGIGRLKGQFTFSVPCSASIKFPREGTYELIVKVVAGKLRICHNSYNPDGGSWVSLAHKGQTNSYDIEQGIHKFTVSIQKHYGYTDQISLTNMHLKNEAVFTFRYDLP